MGEDAYNNRIIELLGKLPDSSAPSIGGGGGVANDYGNEDSGSDTWMLLDRMSWMELEIDFFKSGT